MPALDARLLYLLFDSANMHRWNDHLRPVDLTELDKQSHKAMIAWYLAKCEETAGVGIDWRMLIEHCLFSFIQRAVLTDLKPQVFHRIVSECRTEVNEFVISEFDRIVPDTDPGLRERFVQYLSSDLDSKEDAVIRAAHYLATKWEFELIYESNRSLYGIDATRSQIEEQIQQHTDLIGVRMLMSPSDGGRNFIDIVGQLRFQQRWARTPRIPKTAVLGHSLLVADAMLLHDIDSGVDDRQLYNDFYTGLFHDIPEVLTKDVITPIKVSVSGLTHLLEKYEMEAVESTILPLLDPAWHKEFCHMALDPFTDIDDPEFGRRNGKDLKTCDLLGAFMEASISRRYGVSSSSLRLGEEGIREKLLSRHNGIDTARIIDGLDSLDI